jgi:hypothetical protein
MWEREEAGTISLLLLVAVALEDTTTAQVSFRGAPSLG